MIKVFLVDDEIAMRENIRNFFPWAESGYKLVGEAPDGEIALPMIQDSNPDILVTDIRMPFMDGLDLSHEVKRIMPWIKIVIVSGYDDFSYAQKAISLGIHEYLLKPITSRELLSALDRVSNCLLEEKRAKEQIENIRRKLMHGNCFVMDKLIDSLINADAADALKISEQMRSLGINLVAERYIILDITFTCEGEDPAPGQAALYQLAEKSGGSVQLCTFSKGMKALVLGNNDNDIDERACSFANSALHELKAINTRNVLITIGDIVATLADVERSMKSARHLRHIFMHQPGRKFPVIIGVKDMRTQSVTLERLELKPLYEYLEYIPAEALPDVFERYVSMLDSTEIHSAVTLNYLQIDTLMTAIRLVRDVGGEPSQVLPIRQYEAGIRVNDLQSDVSSSLSLLREALLYRSSRNLIYGNPTVVKACSYLAQHFADSNLKLKDVAREVAMSNSRFSTVFSQETGLTFTEYLKALRMSEAKKLLKGTSLHSSDICFLVGYNDPHYFCYQFKKNEGMTPSEYRKKHNNNLNLE